jgi:hypothetical protein
MRSNQALLALSLLVLIGGCRAPMPAATEPTPDATAGAAAPGSSSSPEQRAIEVLLEEADRALAELRLTTPADDNALDRYLHVLVLEPGHAEALAGIDRVVETYLDLSLRATARGDTERARHYLDLAEQVHPGHPRIAATRARVERALAAPVHRFELDAEALAQRDPRLAIRLAGFGSAAKREELLVLIRAPRDDWGRWIYQQMNEAPPGIRLRARSEIGRPPAIELRQP